MNCICGHPIVANTPCERCGKLLVKCPSCGGELFTAPTTCLLACTYCDTPLHQLESTEIPYYPVNISPEETVAQLETFLLNRFGIPSDLKQQYTVRKARLVFIPIRLYTVQAFLNSTIFKIDTKAVILHPRLWYLPKLKEHRFSVRVKQIMLKEHVRSLVYSVRISKEEADRLAYSHGKRLLEQLKVTYSQIVKTPKVEYVMDGEVLYPLYEVDYYYRSKLFRGVIDASNGVVCVVEHPMSSTTRTMLITASIMLLVVTFILTIGLLILDFVTIFTPIVIFIIGVVLSLRMLWNAMNQPLGAEFTVSETTSKDMVSTLLGGMMSDYYRPWLTNRSNKS